MFHRLTPALWRPAASRLHRVPRKVNAGDLIFWLCRRRLHDALPAKANERTEQPDRPPAMQRPALGGPLFSRFCGMSKTEEDHPLFVKDDTRITKEALGQSGTHSILKGLNAW